MEMLEIKLAAPY